MSNSPHVTAQISGRTPLGPIAALYLRLGTTAFGGPAAHIAMMQNEVVRRRGWLSEQQFLDYLSACNLIPGPSSTELAIYIGYRQAGIPGLIVAGSCFILPATAMVSAIAWAYVRYSQLPAVQQLMNGIKPVVIAIIVQALIGLSKTALKTTMLKILAVAALACCAVGVNAVILLLAGGAASLAWSWSRNRNAIDTRIASIIMAVIIAIAGLIVFFTSGPAPLATATAPTAFSMTRLFLYFLKIGSILYGSGYVLLAFLRTDLVQNWHWLTASQLLDAAAVGQVTPGPVFTTATFIGYLLAGIPGAIVSTVGIFLPSFLLVAFTARHVDQARKSPIAGALLDGVNVASLALMADVTFQLGRDSLTGFVAVAELTISVFLLWRYKVNPTWLIAGGAAVGLMVR